MNKPTRCQGVGCFEAPIVIVIETPRLGMETPIALCADCYESETAKWGEENVVVGARRTRALEASHDERQASLGEWSE